MPCIDRTKHPASPRRPAPGGVVAAALALLLAACSTPPPPPKPQPPAPAEPPPVAGTQPQPTPLPAPRVPAAPAPTTPAAPSSPSAPPTSPAAALSRPVSPSAGVPKPQVRRHVTLGPAAAARNWDDFKQQAARRLVQSNPDGTFLGSVPEPLLAIPVLEVELNADGSVRRVQVLRHPTQARDTTQLAIDAVHRAAPYGAMSRLPLPWKWVEVFLFDDDRRFKPRELDK